jgi:flagellar basal-body rod protein FlgC
MGDAISTAVSGLAAASTRLSATASNIANSQDTAPLSPEPGGVQPYQPLTVTQTARPGGGTTATEQPVTPASTAIYDPNSPFADVNGNVAAPNLDLSQQVVDLKTTALAYDANVKVIQTASQMQGYLLNIFS